MVAGTEYEAKTAEFTLEAVSYTHLAPALEAGKEYTVTEVIPNEANYTLDGEISIEVSYQGGEKQTSAGSFTIPREKFTSVTGITIRLTNKANRGNIEFTKYGDVYKRQVEVQLVYFHTG